ncbi:MAG: sugar phosphorylase [Anaerolineae bacterium]|nr:sugar phosphorylase [Anaerolineae bacterium]
MTTTFELPDPQARRMRGRLAFLYGEARADEVWVRLAALLAENKPRLQQGAHAARELTERDVILITYGDQVQEAGIPPLQTLHEFLASHLHEAVSGVHLLPFFPYSSDDGFAVIDYLAVDPLLGSWDDIERFRADFRLMFDAVINHISSHSAWFAGFKQGDPIHAEDFIIVEPGTDLSEVVRPRTLPLLTPVETANGEKLVWTTFSDDQIDLNYANPDVLLRVLRVLLEYVAHGASLIRLDAIAYLWKEIGTPCIHLPQTHAVVKLMRDVLDAVAPWVLIITETNVPHEENISYFGDGTDEAQLVYQFSLPPLVLHTFAVGDVHVLNQWASTLEPFSATTTYFNFTASHDGIGVRPAQGFLNAAEIEALCERARAHGGFVSYKVNSDGSQSPYELNVTYFDALSDPHSAEPLALQAQRFLSSQAIMLALRGVPGIYFHSLVGSRNDRAGAAATGHNRSINREKLSRKVLEAALVEPESLRSLVMSRYRDLIQQRRSQRAFHPNGGQQILTVHPGVFAVLRTAPEGREAIVALHSVVNETVTIELDLNALGLAVAPLSDLCGAGEFSLAESGRVMLALAPYQVCWLRGVNAR